MRERREKVRARGRSTWRERVQGERLCTGGREFESKTRGSQTRESRRAGYHKRGVREPRYSKDTR